MGAVYKREIKAYMNNVYGFLFAAVLLLVVGVMMFMFNLNPNLASSEIVYALSYGQFAMMLMVPVLCMRTMAEDRRNKTDMFYLSLPLRTSSVVLGKYFALLTVFAIPMLVICLYPVILGMFGTVNYAAAYTSILAFFLMGAALLAVCMFLSSLTDHLVIAAVLGVLAMLALFFLSTLASLLPATALASYIGLLIVAILLAVVVWLVTKSPLVTSISAVAMIVPLSVLYAVMEALVKSGKRDTSVFEGLFPSILSDISPFYQFDSMAYGGYFDVYAVTMLLSVTVFFVFATVQAADKRRWS